MPRQVYTAVVERNVTWEGAFATEPYEAGWAAEALIFIRVLKGGVSQQSAAVQPDGIHWLDEGTASSNPTGWRNALRQLATPARPILHGVGLLRAERLGRILAARCSEAKAGYRVLAECNNA